MSALHDFLGRHGITAPVTHPIRAGRNSEVTRIVQGDRQWILKHYYRQPGDPRDRLGVEYGFLCFLAEAGVPRVALPLGKNDALGYALYSYLPGVRPSVITSAMVTEAARFVLALNEHRDAAAALPNAADACFTMREHVALMTTRVARLVAVTPESETERAAHAFVVESLAPLCERLQETARGDTYELRILSPSDFGFHNTLQDDHLSFVDFEYAGWDDPAKLLCDFCCQPELPVTAEQGRQFCEEVSRALPHADAILERVQLLLPVHRLKWCCILLNELRSDDRKRRMHASGSVDLGVQLDKARRYFQDHLS